MSAYSGVESVTTPTLYGFTHADYAAAFDYNPDTGVFLWRPRADNPSFSTRFAGQPAMTVKDSRGYLKGGLFYTNVWAHRVAFFMVYNETIPHDIDHINGVRTDNRIENLRAVSVSENRKNAARRSDNTSGIVGVSWMRTKARWRARFWDRGKEIHLGLFECKNEAESALRARRAAYGYHENHGREPYVKA
jgi:hypothetical protein